MENFQSDLLKFDIGYISESALLQLMRGKRRLFEIIKILKSTGGKNERTK